MKFLLDANILFGALMEAHPFHSPFRRWLSAHQKAGLGTCAEVRLAYLRLSMNPDVMNQAPLGASEAWESLESFLSGVAPMLIESTPPREKFVIRAERHRDVQDFYLVQLASDAGCRLATHDARLCRQWPDHTERIG
jgi:toxin-antitoxin system PIN domain toxin